jgi:hypothetical protein
MMYLVAIFIPPVYFIVRKKWGGFIINSIFYGLACLLVLSIVFILAAPIFWAIAMVHAMWHLRKDMFLEQAEVLATKMAEKMHQVSQPPIVQNTTN